MSCQANLSLIKPGLDGSDRIKSQLAECVKTQMFKVRWPISYIHSSPHPLRSLLYGAKPQRGKSLDQSQAILTSVFSV